MQGILLIFAIVFALFTGAGLLFGFAANWLIPAIDPGIGAVFGLIAVGMSIWATVELIRMTEERVAQRDALAELLTDCQARRKSRRRRT